MCFANVVAMDFLCYTPIKYTLKCICSVFAVHLQCIGSVLAVYLQCIYLSFLLNYLTYITSL